MLNHPLWQYTYNVSLVATKLIFLDEMESILDETTRLIIHIPLCIVAYFAHWDIR